MKRFATVTCSALIFITCSILLASAFFIRIRTPTGSMLPTIQKNETVIVKKQSAGFERLDIVVFASEDGELLLKRIIGLGGETIELKEGTLYINGVYYPEPYLGSADSYSGTFYVPEGTYFLLGDNRAQSHDSRFWVTPYIAQGQIVGKAVLRLYPWLEWINTKG